MKKIAIISKNLSVGGIQRSLINLLKNMDVKKYQIDCYLYEDVDFYKDSIPKSINIIIINPRNKIRKFIPFSFNLKLSKSRLMEKEYDYVIDFDGYQTDTALDTILSKSKCKIYWIHQDLYMKSKEEIKYRVLHFFMKSKYKYYNKYVAVSKGIIEPFEKLNNISISNKTTIIPNYIDSKSIIENSKEECNYSVDKNKYNFVSVGRICKAKGYDILLNYLFELKSYRKDFHFYLIGDGVDKGKIEKLINKLELDSFVTLLGNKKNPFKYLKLMDGFILTSRYEGQGMVILEAISLGLEIFIPKRLEKYNEGIKGRDNLLHSFIEAKKLKKVPDYLIDYNNKITKQVEKLLK